MSNGIIIGLSGKIASGKSSVARYLGEYYLDNNYQIVSYADALKSEGDQIIKIIQDNKLLPDIVHNDYFDDIPPENVVETISILLDDVKTGRVSNIRERTESTRKFLQYWGTEVRRAQNYNYWINAFNKKVLPLLEQGINVIVDDVRFINEADNILINNGFLVRLNVSDEVRRARLGNRDGNTFSVISDHPSETSLDKYDKFSLVYDVIESDTLSTTCADIYNFLFLLSKPYIQFRTIK